MADNQAVQSAQRIFHILETLAENGAMGVTEIGQRTGLNKTTVFRLLNTLVSMGYARKEIKTEKYTLTFKLLGLAGCVIDALNVPAAVHPHLENLAAVTGETVHFVQREDVHIVYIDKVESAANSIRMVSHIGLHLPMFCTGVGKALLAELSDSEIAGVWERSPVKQLTEHTIVDFDAFMAEITQIREHGYALDNEENELGVRCIAAAVRDYTGKANNAFSISAPLSRMSDERLQILAQQVLQTKQVIVQEMGFRGK